MYNNTSTVIDWSRRFDQGMIRDDRCESLSHPPPLLLPASQTRPLFRQVYTGRQTLQWALYLINAIPFSGRTKDLIRGRRRRFQRMIISANRVKRCQLIWLVENRCGRRTTWTTPRSHATTKSTLRDDTQNDSRELNSVANCPVLCFPRGMRFFYSRVPSSMCRRYVI